MVKVVSTKQIGGAQEGLHLELVDGGEVIQCFKSGEKYGVPKKCLIQLTPDTGVKKIITGASIPGYIVKVPMEPYPFKDPLYHQIYWLKHGYAYLPKIGEQTIGATRIGEL